MSFRRIELICDIPDSVTDEELNQFLLFKHHGHSIDGGVLDKFRCEELEVCSFRVEEH